MRFIWKWLNLGATAYIGLEQEDDEKRYQDKQDAAKQVRDAQLYLVNIFWEYATNIDRFNYTEVAYVFLLTILEHKCRKRSN